MKEFDREYLELLAEKYPNEAAACSELINLSSILALPKGTEHFISDLHGEYAAVWKRYCGFSGRSWARAGATPFVP